MGRVHILTFHRAINYGAVLQCYALHKTINKMTDCDVIDYSKTIKSNIPSIKSWVKSILVFRRERIKRNKFRSFIDKNIILTDRIDSYDGLCSFPWDKTDIFCVGSDQVWNWDFTKGDKAYFLEFAPAECKKFSYAASIGQDLDDEHIELFKNELADYVGVSIREASACDLLKSNGLSCQHNMDPVFLLSKEEWGSISNSVRDEDSPFVLVYLLQKAPNLLKAASEYAQKCGKRIVFISTGLRKDIKGEYIVKCGPEEFLRYFMMADAVFTNSFHGVSFSILFNKEFYFELLQDGTKTNSRLLNIVEMFGLQKQNIRLNSYNDNTIDYHAINEKITMKRIESITYLKNCIFN